MEIIAGIYKIEDIETGNVYVGKADKDNGILKRWSCHKSLMKARKHYCKELQDAFNSDPKRIKWEILEEFYGEDEELIEKEQYWIDYCKKIDGWNVLNKAKAVVRSKVKDTSKMRLAQVGENNGNNKFSAKTVSEILWLRINGYKPKQINEFYEGMGIRAEYICRIGTDRWVHIKPTKPSFIA